MSSNQKLIDFIRGANRIPAFPGVVSRLFEAIDSPGSSAHDIARVIESDPGMAARVLKLANSSFYAQRGQISTVRHAVVVLGNKTVRSLALTVWTHMLRREGRTADDMHVLSVLFNHGLYAGIGASVLICRIDRHQEEEAFMAGLLHDIGRVALLCQLGTDYSKAVLDHANKTHVDPCGSEREALGFDHTNLGGELLNSWNLPTFLVEAAAGHHGIELVPEKTPILAAVSVADMLAGRVQPNVAPDAPRQERDELAKFFGVATDEDLVAYHAACRMRFELFGAALR